MPRINFSRLAFEYFVSNKSIFALMNRIAIKQELRGVWFSSRFKSAGLIFHNMNIWIPGWVFGIQDLNPLWILTAIRGHSLNTYAEFSKNLTFLTPEFRTCQTTMMALFCLFSSCLYSVTGLPQPLKTCSKSTVNIYLTLFYVDKYTKYTC